VQGTSVLLAVQCKNPPELIATEQRRRRHAFRRGMRADDGMALVGRRTCQRGDWGVYSLTARGPHEAVELIQNQRNQAHT